MIRPMTKADRGAVLDLIAETGFFRPDEVRVAEELIDIYLGHPDQRDYDIVVAEDDLSTNWFLSGVLKQAGAREDEFCAAL